ncbi:MAG: hypothetical protein EHM35_19440 [Planctomycetaceae bacterium]|nr:MAG: hypothetical protein EHM35_19440 [Planctomycetaceae bacterium]
MANPPKQKGTKFETEVVNLGKAYGLNIERTAASTRYDVRVNGSTGRIINALVTRPDYGQALASIPLRDFFHLLSEHGDAAFIECKRLKKVALHRIYEEKFS